MSTVAQEQVLVVPTAVFHQIGHFQGFTSDVDRYLPRLLNCGELSYRPRGVMEEDPNFKQLIPYVVFRHTDSAGNVTIFNYQRGGGSGEARLRTKRSVGVGGHISTVDVLEDSTAAESAEVYRRGLERELSEEVVIESPYQETCLGLINDDETDVGKVHLGVVHAFDLEAAAVRPREDDIQDTGFSPLDAISAEIDRYESWSQIAVRALVDLQ